MHKLTRVFTAPTYTEAATATQRFDVPDSHGLHLAYTTNDHAGDIVFIHGLGGSPRKTWSRGHGTSAFWPQWLSDDSSAAPSTTPQGDADALSRFRLWAFGYNAKFKGPQTNLEIVDFATDLLLLLCGETRIRESSCPGRGRRSSTPILLVGHSLGGLVAKKACAMLAAAGRAGPYAALRGRIRGILFLATPHRGSPYAGVLNNVLTVAPAAGGASSQPYVAELAARSAVVQGISKEFQEEAQRMLLCSFYETKRMRVGFTSIMVVDEASSVMGYAHELSYGLEADHRSICKYRGRNDENFCKVKAVLKMWTSQLEPNRQQVLQLHGDRFPYQLYPCWDSASMESLDPMHIALLMRRLFNGDDAEPAARIRYLLGLDDTSSTSQGDACLPTELFQKNTWSFSKRLYNEWTRTTEPICWLVGEPGTGKSTIARFMAEHFRAANVEVLTFSFQQKGQRKVTFADLIRNVASQLAMTSDGFRQELFALQEIGSIPLRSTEQQTAKKLTELLKLSLLKLPQSKPLVWVLDNIHECDDPSYLLGELKDITDQCAVKVFATSPALQDMTLKIARQRLLEPSDTQADGQMYVASAVQQLAPRDQGKQELLQEEILTNAEGSFGWATSVMRRLKGGLSLHEAVRDHPLSELAESFDVPQDTMKLDDNIKRLLLGAKLKLGSAVRWPETSIWHMSAEIDVVTRQGPVRRYMLKTTVKGKEGRAICRGRFESLKAMHAAKPDFCPKPYAWGRLSDESKPGFFILSEYHYTLQTVAPAPMMIRALSDLHARSQSPTGKFGFPVRTYNGLLPQAVDFWHESWCVVFRAHLAQYCALAAPLLKGSSSSTESGFALLTYLVLQKVVPRLLLPLQQHGRRLKASLIHGGVWESNTGVSAATAEAVVFDGACFYGHSEYDLANWGAVRSKDLRFEWQEYYRETIVSKPENDWLDRFRLYSLPFSIAQLIAEPQSKQRRNAVMSYLVEAVQQFCFDAVDGLSPSLKRISTYSSLYDSDEEEEEEEEELRTTDDEIDKEEEEESESEYDDDEADDDFVFTSR